MELRSITGALIAGSAKSLPMPVVEPSFRSFLDALEDPALLILDRNVQIANPAARALLGAGIEGSDVRIAIRHPEALEFILPGRAGDLDVTGIGAVGRPWTVQLRRIDEGLLFVRLIDRSAAQAAERMRVDFVANASHELRTPLSVIVGYAETIEDGDADPELSAKFGGIVGTEAKRMLRIIEDLMSLSRIEADRFIAPAQQVSVKQLVTASIANCGHLAQSRNCEFRLEAADDLPPIHGDEAQLLQLFENLLNNALRYGCGASAGTVVVTVGRDRSDIVVTVADQGPGIAREHLPRLTERFYRVDAARSRDSGGTGLGLAIVKHIVERHRGTLSIDSQVGEGTSVTVRLPIAPRG
ncbi:ATPase [Sphingomonas sinipercae]|uniref:histidine kinase n=1 Tax=Sphingomonas sinipercae TaxID=2714944 RepID=A0A6G7ZKC9_9SPHN|nr:ATP-binding protein [Sphingomonas sinipercae]QIL01375.1 ATPase [Sphingomonas sinipercae]